MPFSVHAGNYKVHARWRLSHMSQVLNGRQKLLLLISDRNSDKRVKCRVSLSNPRSVGHMWPKMALIVAQNKFVSFHRTLQKLCMDLVF